MKKENDVVLGVLGGSGVYKMPETQIIQEHKIKTPFGKPSESISYISKLFLPGVIIPICQ